MVKNKHIIVSMLCFAALACTNTAKKTAATAKSNTQSVAESKQNEVVVTADKNDPQGILYAFQRFVKFPADTIVDSLERNGNYTIITINGKRVGGKARTEDYWGYKGEEEAQIDSLKQIQEDLKKQFIVKNDLAIDVRLKQLDEEIEVLKEKVEMREIHKSAYYLNTAKNTIRNEDSYIIGVSAYSVDEYKLLRSAHKPKFICSNFFGTSAFGQQGDFEIYDYDPHTGTFSLDTVALKLFRVDQRDFYIESTPDSVVDCDHFFDIVHNKEGVAVCEFNCGRWRREEDEYKWLRGNVIRFDYVNGEFIRSAPYFE